MDTVLSRSNRRLYSKCQWQKVLSNDKKPRRLNLKPNDNGLFYCPILICDSEGYKSQRGCRKHVSKKHGWYYFFDEKPDVNKYFPEECTRLKASNRTRASTESMPSFLSSCKVALLFARWLQSPGGGGKSSGQSDQTTRKSLKYFKFCCSDVSENWDIPVTVVDYCIASVTLISDFIDHLQGEWKLGYSGTIGYMNALSNMLDYRRSMASSSNNISVFVAAEIYLDRVKKCLVKKMKVQWNEVLSVDYLTSINCWASLQDMQNVIPYHSNRFAQIILNAGQTSNQVPANDLSFATSFVVTVLFILVKASRPMTYQFLTTDMIAKVKEEGGFINQTIFKTSSKYGFDSLLFSKDVKAILDGYIKCIRPRLNPVCNYLLVTRNGTQLSQLTNVFGRMVYLAIGKFVNPTRYRQIIETESLTNLQAEEQAILSHDQKHSSRVAKVHYQKLQSEEVALRAQSCMQKLINVERIEDNNESSVKKTKILGINPQLSASLQPENEQKALHSGRTKKVAFSDIEDQALLDGIRMYGYGKWTSILKDPELCFHPSRKPCTLLVRAKKICTV